MGISVLGVNKANLFDIITDDSVYVIKKDYFDKDKFRMMPVKKADVNDLMSEDTLVVRITK